MAPAEAPPAAVLRAFGAAGAPRPLPGGQGTSWLCGDLVLKPGGGAVHDWLCEVLEDLEPVGFRIAPPLRALGGGWSVEGWEANGWVAGAVPEPGLPGWLQVLEAGRAFHRCVADLPRPHCLAAREDVWAVADRAAWGERDVEVRPELDAVCRRLRDALEPLGPGQVVHGDLTGNVLVSESSPPTVLDVSPYWRPTAYAEGVVVADALCWHGADAGLVEAAGVPVPAVARALLFRALTTTQVASAAAAEDEALRYAHAAAVLGL